MLFTSAQILAMIVGGPAVTVVTFGMFDSIRARRRNGALGVHAVNS